MPSPSTKQPRTVPFRVADGDGVATIFAALGEIIARPVKARAKAGDGARLVFHRDSRPLGDFRKPWAAACEAGGRLGLLFHDLRRSAVRNFSAAGVPDRAAIRITGHRTRSVYDRYNIVSDDDVRAALERTQALSATEQPITDEPERAAERRRRSTNLHKTRTNDKGRGSHRALSLC